MSSEQLHLTPIANCSLPDKSCDIIFVHGLNGDSVQTWDSKLYPATRFGRLWFRLTKRRNKSATNTFWPLWMSNHFPTAAIWCLGYPAASSAWRGQAMPLYDRSQGVLQLLRYYGIGSVPIIFVSHSLGGLLVKMMLRVSTTHKVDDWTCVSDSTRGVLFLATPHAGSSLASIVNIFRVVARPSWTISDLQPHAPSLRELNDWFRNNFDDLNIQAHVLRENEPTGGVIVVDETSSIPGIPFVSVIAVDKNHINICKPLSENDVVFLETKRFIERCMQPSDVKLRATKSSPEYPPGGGDALSPDGSEDGETFSNSDSQKGPQILIGSELGTIDIKIDQPFSSYSDDDQDKIMEKIRVILELDGPPKAKRRRGSVLLNIEVTPAQAETLKWAFERGELDDCAVVAISDFEPHVEATTVPGQVQVDEALGVPVVGTLPTLSDHPAVAQPIDSILIDSIDHMSSRLMYNLSPKRRQVVLVSSATAQEGRTSIASQLAASLARAGQRTLLVDGDLRRPALHALFNMPLECGMCEVLRTEVDVTDAIRPTHAKGLWLLTAGYCDVGAIHSLATEQIQLALEKLRSEYDFIIIDGAPVLGMSDALIFGQYCDGVILAIHRRFGQMPKVNEAALLLRSVSVRLFGAIVN